MEFSGVLIFQGLIKNNVKLSGHDQGKIMWSFQESWFQALNFLKGVTQLCGVSKGEALLYLEFPTGKVKNFSGIAHSVLI